MKTRTYSHPEQGKATATKQDGINKVIIRWTSGWGKLTCRNFSQADKALRIMGYTEIQGDVR